MDGLDRATAALLALTGTYLTVWGVLAMASRLPAEGLLYVGAGASAYLAAHGVLTAGRRTLAFGLPAVAAEFLAQPVGLVGPVFGAYFLAYFIARRPRFAAHRALPLPGSEPSSHPRV